MKHPLFIVTLLAGLGFNYAAFSQTSGNSYRIKGLVEMTKGDNQQALSDFNSAIPFYKDSAQVLARIYYHMGSIYLSLHNYRNAIDAYNNAIAINPNDGSAYWGRADAFGDSGQYQLALNDLSKAISYYNGDWKSLAALYDLKATAEKNLHDYTDAINDESTSLTFNPENGEAYWIRSDCYEQLNQYNNAINDITAAINYYKDDSSLAKLYGKLGYNKYNTGDYNNAIDAFNHCLALNPNDKDAFLYRIDIYKDDAKYYDAINECDFGIRNYPADTAFLAQLYCIRGYCLTNTEKLHKSIESFTHSISLDPNYGEAWYDRAAAYEDTLDYADAINDYIKVIPLFNKDKESLSIVYSHKGMDERYSKQYQNAVNDELEAIALNPANAFAYLELGSDNLLLNKKAEAVLDFNNAVKFDSADYVTPFAQYFMGDSAEALTKVMKNMITHITSPQDLGNDYYYTACLMTLMNKPGDALSYLKKAIDRGISKSYARYDHYFIPLRNNPGFIALTKL
jgi:tetratricopeptide (TPR) repeat protein